MLAISPTKEQKDISQLPIYRAEKIATATDDAGKEFSIYAGLQRNMVEQLKAYSLDRSDVELQKSTRDYERFGVGDYDARYAKVERLYFALVAEPGEKLAALSWFGPKAYPLARPTEGAKGDTHTAVFRSYGAFRGQGLMTDFSRYTMDLYLRLRPGVLMWLETNSENGTRLFKKLGFEETGEISSEGKTVMVLKQ